LPVSGSKEEVVILLSNPSDYRKIMEIQGILNARNYVFRVGLPEHILQYLGEALLKRTTPKVLMMSSRTLRVRQILKLRKMMIPVMMKALLKLPGLFSWLTESS